MYDEDVAVSPAKRLKLNHDHEGNGDSHSVIQERRKGVASIKSE